MLKGRTCTPSSSWAFQQYQDGPAGLRRGYSVVTSKQGITNTLTLPVDKMLYIYMLCSHSEQQWALQALQGFMLFIKPTTLLPSNRAFTFTLETMLVLLNLPHVPWTTVGNLQNNKIKIMLYRSFQLRDYIFFLIKKRFSCLVFMFP